jgi:hypothetical protein
MKGDSNIGKLAEGTSCFVQPKTLLGVKWLLQERRPASKKAAPI